MGATALLDELAIRNRQRHAPALTDPEQGDPMRRNPTLFDLLGEPRVLDGNAVTHPPQTTVPGGGAAPMDAPDGEWAHHSWPGGEPTLDDLIVDAWEGLTAHAAVACPVCGGTMEPERHEGSRSGNASGESERPAPVLGSGRCRDCGTTLS